MKLVAEIIYPVFTLLCLVAGDVKPRYISDDELKTLFTSLLDSDENNAWRTVRWDLQERSPYDSNTDLSPRPLLKVDSEALKVPTVALLARFYDNYIPDSTKIEEVTAEERKEEEAFMNAVLNTTVINLTRNFLRSKGMAAAETPSKFRDYLKNLWFTLYSRGNRKKGSSAFEHIFLGEFKNGQVSGLHNWLFVANQEKSGHFNYYGWSKKLFFDQKTPKGTSKQLGILKLKYAWNGLLKPAGSMFIATSPELEIAIYTVCSLARPNDRCNLAYGTKTFHIQTYAFTYNNNTLISSAYPQI